jgi:endonuclease/exonuclease/phosphatase family metal-dependent hydrolase
MDNALDFLQKENPDILSLQEVYHNPGIKEEKYNIYTSLAKQLGFPHHVFEPTFLHVWPEGKFLQGNAIFSKFPISNHRVHFFEIPFGEFVHGADPQNAPRNVLHAQINVQGNELNVFNLHGIWGLHGDDTDRRLNMVDHVLAFIGSSKNVILSGDFNLNENLYPRDENGKPILSKPRRSQAVAKLEERLVNVFKDERVTSFNLKRKDFDKTGYGCAVVDMVFTSPNIKILNHQCPNVDASDHLPTIVELEINK